jgi:adenylosuccinate synthase
MLRQSITRSLCYWFDHPGAYVLVDGQFGSTGKGLFAGLLAEIGQNRITHVTTNAGPNSGHTAYFDFWGAAKANPALGEQGYYKIVTQQVPVASVFLKMFECEPITIINGGAIVEPGIFDREVHQWLSSDKVWLHPCAAMITPEHQQADQDTTARIASTGKGIGPAMAHKLNRHADAVAGHHLPFTANGAPVGSRTWDNMWDWSKDVVFVETAQGFSLGINSARFYPHTTSRECTVAQALADARIPVQKLRRSVACFRTLPIRVGNTPTGYSGDMYPDQTELTWDEVGQPPELTTVTKRVRRIFSWSRMQFRECIAANRPDAIFLNFCNYLNDAKLSELISFIVEDYIEVTGGHHPEAILLGFGPHTEDIITVDDWLKGRA